MQSILCTMQGHGQISIRPAAAVDATSPGQTTTQATELPAALADRAILTKVMKDLQDLRIENQKLKNELKEASGKGTTCSTTPSLMPDVRGKGRAWHASMRAHGHMTQLATAATCRLQVCLGDLTAAMQWPPRVCFQHTEAGDLNMAHAFSCQVPYGLNTSMLRGLCAHEHARHGACLSMPHAP